MRILTFIISLTIILSHHCFAAFEETQTDARVFGMSGAGVALADLPQGGWCNPALPALCEIQSVSAGAGVPFALTGLAATAASGSYQRGRFGLGASLLTAGDQLYRETTARMTLGMMVYGRAAAGVAVNGHLLSIERYGSAATVGLDAGIIGSPIDGLVLAVAADNVNHPSIGNTDEEIGQALSCGISWKPAAPVTLAFQVQAQKGWPAQLRFGQEYNWRGRLFLRAGFSDRPDQVSLGFGATVGKFRLDYAARTHPVLALSHCLSLHYETQRSARVERAAPFVMTRTKPQSLVRLDLNTASHADLMLLPEIGGTRARQILALRDSLGRFASLNDLLLIKGMPYRELERIAPYTMQELRRVEVEPAMVNINTATADELCVLPGIGPGTAQDIIAYRLERGPFKSPDDLLNVRGIGRVKFEKFKDLITVGP